MRRLASFLVLVVSAAAQQTSPTGFGRMIYPGTGGPTAPSRGGAGGYASRSTGGGGFGRVIYPGTGAPVAVRPGVPGGFLNGVPPRPQHLPHSRSAIVPFPVFYGSGYYDSFEPPNVADYGDYGNGADRPPLVIINQGYQPEQINPSLRDYSNTTLPPAAPRTISAGELNAQSDAAATIYQIALTDGSVFEAVGYWVEGDTLNYITVEGSHNRASMDLVDRDRSKKLNDQQNVEFKLPRR